MEEKEDSKLNEKILIKDNKCPDYILRNSRKYYNKKKEDPEFVEKERARIKAYRDANRSHINELERIRRRELKKQKEKMHDVSNVVVDAGTGIGVINTNLVEELAVKIEKKVNIDYD